MTPYKSVSVTAPEFEAFLSASIGEQNNGVSLSMLSALARLDIDPWQEAARLAGLPTELAKTALVQFIGRLPAGVWKPSDASGIADRLVKLLPSSNEARQATAQVSAEALRTDRPSLLWVLAFVLALALFFNGPSRLAQLFQEDSRAIPLEDKLR